VPSLCIRQPYRHKIAFTLYGVEVWAFGFSGEQETVVEEMASRPQVSVSGPGSAWPPARLAWRATPDRSAQGSHGAEQAAHAHGAGEAHGSGLRIRIGS
jgi:hypothetical protein